jgi:uncharacterized protein (DUF58 family)
LKKYSPTSRSRSEEETESRTGNRAWNLPFSFSITREGWVFILSIFLLLAAALSTGNNLLFLILSMLLSMILTSGIFARNSLRSVSVSLQLPESVFEGERVPVKVSLRNQKQLVPALSLTVEDESSANGRSLTSRAVALLCGQGGRAAVHGAHDRTVLRHPAYFPWIPAQSVRSELVHQSFPRRGLYRLHGFRISTRFPFGLFVRGERVSADGQVWVYPSVSEISSELHLLPFLPGKLESLREGHGESLFAIRKYQEGESVRLVDWKATAKTGELMAREFARDEENNFCLLLDTITARDGSEYFEKAVSLCASLAQHFAREGAEFEFLTPRERIPRGIGAAHLDRVFRALAVVQCEPDPVHTPTDLREELSKILQPKHLEAVLSAKIFKIIITSRPRGSFPAAIWRSSHVIYFDEL